MVRFLKGAVLALALLGASLGAAPAAAQPARGAALAPARVSASGYAPEARDSRGGRTTFVPANAVDGRLDTAWRVPGDGRDAWLLLEFHRLVPVSQLQISPGYAKIDAASGVDRFRQNRAVKRIRLEFSGGQTLEAGLADSPRLQAVAVPNIETAWVRVVVIETRAPASRDGRDFTPISEVSVSGRAAPEPRYTPQLRAAEQTLNDFFYLLNQGRYDEAAPLFGGNLDDIRQFADPNGPQDAASVFADACGLLQCLTTKRIAYAQQVAPDTFRFGVAFTARDGRTFTMGPCCGATENDMPPQSVFAYTVVARGAGYQVLEPPVYVP